MQSRLRFLCGLIVAAFVVSATVGSPLFGADEEHHNESAAGDDSDHGAKDGHGAEGGHGGGHPEGVPMDYKQDLALWSLVTFVCFILVLGKFAWGPIIGGLDKRETKIRQDIADAESARIKAEQMLVEHQQKLDQVQDEIKEILAEARRDADQTRQNIVETAKTEAEATKQRAVVDIERARDQALNELFDAMAGQVASATEYVLSNGLKPADQDKLIQQALTQIGESN